VFPLNVQKLKGFQLQEGKSLALPAPGPQTLLRALAMCPSQSQFLDMPLAVCYWNTTDLISMSMLMTLNGLGR